ncbi:Undecaprenyl-phosphate galactose phosphotransferase [Modestobacter italicus]|uniref:Undecaprenyl-phosphate galactose phosphotransferase n=1 Tax=Modestobacter italicus (strain DSM 44449 / CECT 9708 / BC 501) TaxID=2732864 RepID=I4EXK8_MODI5|nr:sugar transferase [Modestobacter marinus]CCH88121.1 Undecaprenyl-phosphate galactose phosphotransferase [Modestobacter marinus]
MSGRPAVPYLRVKRAVDVVVSGAGLLVGAPVMAVVAAAVRRDLGSPVLFRQLRPGLRGAPFELVKFRTMRTVGADDGVDTDAQRLTPFGSWLRSTSLDELPTLWNVLRGDMSLVGPRPLLMEYLDRYTPDQARRHEVRPGITGLAQVRGRNELSWDQKFAADVEYVDGVGWRADLRILAATLATVLRRQGISAPGAATMHLFTGSPPADAAPGRHDAA